MEVTKLESTVCLGTHGAAGAHCLLHSDCRAVAGAAQKPYWRAPAAQNLPRNVFFYQLGRLGARLAAMIAKQFLAEILRRELCRLV
jgi:hypothetical protein